MISIALVVPCVNNFKGFCELIESISFSEDGPDSSEPMYIEPIIIPNWNNNIGVSRGWNLGIKTAIDSKKFDAILVSNDDIIIPRYSIRNMYERLYGDEYKQDVPLVSARNTKDRPGFDNTLGNLSKFITEDEGDSPDFSCFMIKENTIDTIGWFDENFSPAYFEDNDYHHRIHCAGFITANLGSAPMLHKSSVSRKIERKDAPLVTHEMFENNRAYYKSKWGGGPGKEVFKTPFNDKGKTHKDW